MSVVEDYQYSDGLADPRGALLKCATVGGICQKTLVDRDAMEQAWGGCYVVVLPVTLWMVVAFLDRLVL